MTPIVDPLVEWMKLPLKERRARAMRYGQIPKVPKPPRQPREYTPAERQLRRERKIARKYGLSKQQWEKLFLEQRRRCGICERRDSGSKYGWATDHCHENGQVRGILCHGCNLGLGAFRDNIAALEAAIGYLRGMEWVIRRSSKNAK